MKRILVVEDEDVIRDFEVINLKRSGYEVVDVPSGEEAMLVFDRNPYYFDVALLDVMMPGIDGFEVCRRMREKNQSIGIIMLTAKSQEMDKVNAKDVYDAAAAGDQNAQAVVKEAATALGYAAAAVSCVVNPEVILLGGGVSAAGSALLDPVEASFKANVLDACGNVRFALAQLGNNAGIYGGAALFFAE